MARIGLVLATMPPLLGEIVRGTLEGQGDMEILAEVARPEQILSAVERTGANVAVVGIPSSDSRALVHELLAVQPRLSIVALTNDGRIGYVHSVRPGEAAIADISPVTLLDAIRATRDGMDVHPHLHPFSAD